MLPIADNAVLPALRDADIASEAEFSTPDDSQSEASSSSDAEQMVDDTSVCWVCTARDDGKLHTLDFGADEVIDGARTTCNRKLKQPIIGVGLQEARASGRAWSPRCWARLPPNVIKAWRDD